MANTLVKAGDVSLILCDEVLTYKLEKNSFGTHGHYRGYQLYKLINGRWMWTGADERCTHVHFDEPCFFGSIKAAVQYFGIQ